MYYILGPALYERHKGFSVRIADDVRKSTVFLGEEIADDSGQSAIDARATGFFVTWTSSPFPRGDEPHEHPGIYLVTARHVAQPLGRAFAIRFNKKDGGSDIQLIECAKWVFHPDETVDVAVLHCGYPEWADCRPIPGILLTRPTVGDGLVSSMKAGEVLPNNAEIGIGDIAYVVGLFHFAHGKKRNLPVIHTGHIAMLPEDEKIRIYNKSAKEYQDVEAYLIEAHGLEGLSGGPVFARTSSPVTASYRYDGPHFQGGFDPSGMKVSGRLHGFAYLIGLWSASWSETASRVLTDGNQTNNKVPVGMGIVVPATKIAETLNREELVLERRAEYERRASEKAASTDSLDLPATDANPTHREDFTRLLGAAARKPPQED